MYCTILYVLCIICMCSGRGWILGGVGYLNFLISRISPTLCLRSQTTLASNTLFVSWGTGSTNSLRGRWVNSWRENGRGGRRWEKGCWVGENEWCSELSCLGSSPPLYQGGGNGRAAVPWEPGIPFKSNWRISQTGSWNGKACEWPSQTSCDVANRQHIQLAITPFMYIRISNYVLPSTGFERTTIECTYKAHTYVHTYINIPLYIAL